MDKADKNSPRDSGLTGYLGYLTIRIYTFERVVGEHQFWRVDDAGFEGTWSGNEGRIILTADVGGRAEYTVLVSNPSFDELRVANKYQQTERKVDRKLRDFHFRASEHGDLTLVHMSGPAQTLNFDKVTLLRVNK
jgi:hypothetical protein